MRSRATSAVRVFDRCARCGTRYLENYDVGKVRVMLGGRQHELVVCKTCRSKPTEPTRLEQNALGCDLSNPVEVMEFIQIHHADPSRIVRSAEHFLPPDVFKETKAKVDAIMAERRAARQAARDKNDDAFVRVYTTEETDFDDEMGDFFDDDD